MKTGLGMSVMLLSFKKKVSDMILNLYGMNINNLTLNSKVKNFKNKLKIVILRYLNKNSTDMFPCF